MKSFLSMVMFNVVVSGIAYWGYILGNHSAEVVASVLLWVAAVLNSIALLLINGAKYEKGYNPKNWFHRVVSAAFDVLNAAIAIYTGGPILAVFILIGAASVSLYIAEKNKAQKLGVSS